MNNALIINSIGCGMCVTSCARGVYEYNYENKKSKVVNPTN